METPAQELAAAIRASVPRIKEGSIRLFGSPFGRPMDNIHRVIGAEAEGDRLIVRFEGGETLVADAPREWAVSERAFRIEKAARVRWEWFHYGRPRTDESLRRMELVVQDGKVLVTAEGPHPAAHPEFPAVQIL